MNLVYYSCRIKEELSDAESYIEEAMCCKVANPSKAEKLSKLSASELEHAGILLEMFEDDSGMEIKLMQSIPLIYTEAHKIINDMYLEGVAKVKLMIQEYSSK